MMTMTQKGEVNQNVLVNSNDISDISRVNVDDEGVSSCCKTTRPHKHLRSKSLLNAAQFLTNQFKPYLRSLWKIFYMECHFQIHEAQHENQYLNQIK